MNTRDKGQRWERRVAGVYERAGYEEFRPEESQYGETDMFGLFDIVLMPTEEAADCWPRMSQVRSGEGSSGVETILEAMRDRFKDGVRVRADVVQYYPGHGGPHPTPWRLRLIRVVGDDYRTMVDEREDGVPAEGDGVVSFLQGHS